MALPPLVLAVVLAAAGDVAPSVTPTTETRAKGDESLEIAVSRELADEPRIHAMQMKVAVRQSVVTLTGTAATTEEREAAEAAVRRVPGVRDVDNKLVVHEAGTPEPGTSAIPELPKPAR